jgi:hypothetical protein
VGGVAVVVDVGAKHAVGGVEGVVWGTTKVVGVAQGVAKVGEACDEGAV